MIVYKTTNLINGKIYIGKDEFNNPNYIGSGIILKKAILKYGKDNFIKEIIEECNSKNILNEREKYWIRFYNSTDSKIGYNIAEGGTGGNTYFGKDNSELDDIKLKISKSLKNRFFTDSHRKNLSKSASSRKGNKPCKFKNQSYEEYLGKDKSNEIKDKISKSLKEHYKNGMSAEQREKISKSTKGKPLGPMSPEHKENLKESFKKRDAVRIENTNKKYLEELDYFLETGINELNYDKAKKVYKKAKYRSLELSKYEILIEQFKIISSRRRANANKNRKKKC